MIRRQAIIWTNDGLVWWRIYVSLGLNELRHPNWHLKEFLKLQPTWVIFFYRWHLTTTTSNMVIFLKNTKKRHFIAHLLAMGCHLWLQLDLSIYIYIYILVIVSHILLAWCNICPSTPACQQWSHSNLALNHSSTCSRYVISGCRHNSPGLRLWLSMQ